MIKYFGFDFPPVGIIDILKHLAPPLAKFYIIDPIGTTELPYHELDSNSYVIITTNEGSSHRWFDRLISTLQSFHVALDHIVIRSCCLWDPDSPVRHIHTIVDECTDFITTLDNYEPVCVDPTHHFVCLNNGHRWQRFELVCQLLKRNLNQFGKISYVQAPPVSILGFPMVLDKSHISWGEQRNISFPELTGALLNVICETAYEPQHEVTQLVYHHRPGMTEKSFKCFALHQIPLWLAPYRAVACYRALGFDVFDDIVDHSYDLESNPVDRINLVADQIERFCRHSQTELHNMKHTLRPRFEQNWAKLQCYANEFTTELPQWQLLFSGTTD